MLTLERKIIDNSIVRRPLLLTMVFVAAYFTTITVNAQTTAPAPAADVIQLDHREGMLITGTVTSIEDGNLIIDSGGKPVRVFLGNMDLKADADTIFKPGMKVEVRGESTGDDFGTMVVKATNVLAVEPAPVAAP